MAGACQLSAIQVASYMKVRYEQGLEFRRMLRQRVSLIKYPERKQTDLGILYGLWDDVYTNLRL